MEFGNGGGGVFCQRSDLESGKKIGVRKLGGGVLPKVRYELGEENWSLEILGGGVCVFCQGSDLESGKKIGVWGGGCSVQNFRIGCSCQFGQKFWKPSLPLHHR